MRGVQCSAVQCKPMRARWWSRLIEFVCPLARTNLHVVGGRGGMNARCKCESVDAGAGGGAEKARHGLTLSRLLQVGQFALRLLRERSHGGVLVGGVSDSWDDKRFVSSVVGGGAVSRNVGGGEAQSGVCCSWQDGWRTLAGTGAKNQNKDLDWTWTGANDRSHLCRIVGQSWAPARECEGTMYYGPSVPRYPVQRWYALSTRDCADGACTW